MYHKHATCPQSLSFDEERPSSSRHWTKNTRGQHCATRLSSEVVVELNTSQEMGLVWAVMKLAIYQSRHISSMNVENRLSWHCESAYWDIFCCNITGLSSECHGRCTVCLFYLILHNEMMEEQFTDSLLPWMVTPNIRCTLGKKRFKTGLHWGSLIIYIIKKWTESTINTIQSGYVIITVYINLKYTKNKTKK